jgi:hypothetical protein
MSGATAEVGMVNEECQCEGKLCVGRVRAEVGVLLYCAGTGSLL